MKEHPMNLNPTLETSQLSLGYGDRSVVKDLDLVIPQGKITAIVGANACGKSTLLRGLSRLLAPAGGTVILDGKDIHQQRSSYVAQRLGLLPQTPLAPEGVSVAELVGRGRYPHQGFFRKWTEYDDDALARALHLTGTAGLAERSIDELSGGQRQRVWIAMVLAQETPLLLLDEPTTYLDLAHQIEVLDLITDLNQERGTTVVMVLHELNLASRYADHMIAMKEGSIAAAGSPHEVITEATVRNVFGLDSAITRDPLTRAPLIIPHSKHTARTPGHTRA